MATRYERILYDLVGRDSASHAFRSAGASASSTERMFSRLGRTAALAGAAIGTAAVAVAAQSVKMATDWQASMEKVHTQAGASQKSVDQLSKAVLNLGKYAEQSPQQLADALFHLKSVGLDNVAAMRALKTASDLAAVGGADLEATTNALAGAWRSGIKGAHNFGQAAATLNAIIGAGNMRMADLVDAMGTGFLPTARSFGLSLKSVGAALALMTDEGIPAQLAATRLRMAINLIGAPSKKAAGELKSIGLSSTALAYAMRSPGGIVAAITLLKKHLDASGLSATKQAQLLSQAFGGGRSSAAVLTLVNNLEVLRRKQQQINDTTSRYGGAVAAQRKTAQAQFALLRSTLDVIQVKIGSRLLPVMVRLAQLANNRLIPDAVKLAKWLGSPDVRPWAEIVGKLLLAATAVETIRRTMAKVSAITGLSRLASAAAPSVTSTAAANMAGAAKVMLDASLNMLRAAGIEADAAGVAGAGRGGGAATAAGGAAAAVAGRSLLSRVGSSLAKGVAGLGWAALLTELVAKPALQNIHTSGGKKNFWDNAFGVVPKGSGWTNNHQLWLNIQQWWKDMTGPGTFGGQIGGFFSHGFGGGGSQRQHFTPVPSHFYAGPGITAGTPRVASHFYRAPGAGITVTAADKKNLLFLEQVYGVGLPKAYRLAEAAGAGLNTKWSAQTAVAANARARVAALTAALQMMHGGQKQATADATAYTTALRLNGVASAVTIAARRRYIQDLIAAHVPAATAVRLANQLSTGIDTLGRSMAATHPTRASLVADLTAAGYTGRQARVAVDAYTTAVRRNGTRSDQARAARAKLVKDLENAGLSASQANKLVGNLGTSISKLHGKNVNVGLTTSGSGKIIITGTGIATHVINTSTGQVRATGGHTVAPGAAAGMLLRGGIPGQDSILLRGMPGELVVPTHMVKAGLVDHLRGMIPGFAAGGLIGGPLRAEGAMASADARVGSAAAVALAAAAMRAARAAAARMAGPAVAGGGGPAAALFRRMYPAWGSGALWAAVNYVAMRESGWNPYAANPTSSARGIWQRIQGWASFYPPGNAYLQNIWGHNYMASRYGGPLGAAAHERAYNWYGNGGTFRAGQLIGVGDRGRELVAFNQPGRVYSPEQSQQILAGASGGQFTGTLVLDSGEFLGVVRGEISQANGRLLRAAKAGAGMA